MEKDNLTDKIKEKNEGYIPLMRRIFENPLWTERRKFSRFEAWIDLLRRARYQEGDETIIDRGEKIVLKEGYILTSLLTLSKDWRWSRTRVKNFILFLNENSSLKIIRLDNRRTILFIVKFPYFKKLIQQTEQQTLHETGQQKNNRKTYTNKDNKENKENKENKDNIYTIDNSHTNINIHSKDINLKEHTNINIHSKDINFKERSVKERELQEREKKVDPHTSLSYLINRDLITQDYKNGTFKKYNANLTKVLRKSEELYNYCHAKGRRYKNYLMFLKNALARDFGYKFSS